MKRKLSTLSGAELGRSVVGRDPAGRLVRGQITAVRHFQRPKRGGGQYADHPMDEHDVWTSVMVKVATSDNKKPDHREILLPSTEEIEVKT